MAEEEDKELERIKMKKLREMLRRRISEESERQMSFPDRPVNLSDMTFKEFIQKYPLVVIDCWAPWCGPCRILSPIIDEIARDYVGKIAFGKLNVDENPRVAMEYGIMSIPTLLIFKNGRLVDRIVGAMPRRMLEPRITRHL
ncbi:thioredoxin [Candidatus Bathyarchaeota archaeon]|nr:MAG: thioredoxin [Candidatus Bathyarchaeota archaeon]